MCLRLLLLLPILLLVSCKTVGLKLDKKEITPPKTAESESRIDENKATKTTEIPAGTTYTKKTTAATEVAPQVTEETIVYTKPAKIVEDMEHTLAVIAPPSKPDVRVQLQAEQNKERRFLLYVAVGALAVAGIMAYLKQYGPATMAAMAGGASFLLWYLAGSEQLMKYVLAVLGLAFLWWLYNRDKDARELKQKHALAEQAMIRSVQSVEELKIDNPAVANEVKEYNDANMDESHKDYIKSLKDKINRKYISERISSSNNNSHVSTS